MSSENTLYDLANEILDNSRKGICGGCGATLSEALLVSNIAAALAAERAKFAAFADEKGEPRKVLGTLPVTADGCIALPGAKVWHPDSVSASPSRVVAADDEYWVGVVEGFGADGFVNRSRDARVSECYSTKEAAEQAATSALDAAKEKR